MGPVFTESFCITKGKINKMKRQPIDWEKIFVNDLIDRGLISKIYKQLIQLNNNSRNQTTLLKMGKRPKETFLQRRSTDCQ